MVSVIAFKKNKKIKIYIYQSLCELYARVASAVFLFFYFFRGRCARCLLCVSFLGRREFMVLTLSKSFIILKK